MMPKSEPILGTKEENFNLAMKEQEILDHTHPSDPYHRIAKANVEYYLNCAAALERGECIIYTTHADRFK